MAHPLVPHRILKWTKEIEGTLFAHLSYTEQSLQSILKLPYSSITNQVYQLGFTSTSISTW